MNSLRFLLRIYILVLVLVSLVCESQLYGFQIEWTPKANLKHVETNLDNEPDGEGDYRVKMVHATARVMVRAGASDTRFRLYITYNGTVWKEVVSKIVHQTSWDELSFFYTINDEAVIPDMQAAGHPFEFKPISGIG